MWVDNVCEVGMWKKTSVTKLKQQYLCTRAFCEQKQVETCMRPAYFVTLPYEEDVFRFRTPVQFHACALFARWTKTSFANVSISSSPHSTHSLSESTSSNLDQSGVILLLLPSNIFSVSAPIFGPQRRLGRRNQWRNSVDSCAFH
jgi:hypothetical protein